MEVSIKVEQVEEVAMSQQQSIFNYTQPNLEGVGSSIICSPFAMNNFKLKSNFILIVQQFTSLVGFKTKIDMII